MKSALTILSVLATICLAAPPITPEPALAGSPSELAVCIHPTFDKPQA
ncbi:uncharacterized protein CTRU02_214696 [Colletotrichum truncatum]|uniref:Uncharacterized protein n=1 Tax=Colletotrichum truncatum TaxID=5467 RepID=A0ACC3YFH0_COLTU|nr:uncharacterized protein CTRU02_09640 [Colletotrichum truncatum]KAF6788322.1 hypothetical protein CTRU02_09640 [Colletotrichum truncatum]